MHKMKNNYRVFIMIMCGMLFMTAMEDILNLLYAIIYGVAFILVLGSYLYITCKKISRNKLYFLHFLGILLLCIANFLSISNISGAILLSISLSISICGTFCLLIKTFNKK